MAESSEGPRLPSRWPRVSAGRVAHVIGRALELFLVLLIVGGAALAARLGSHGREVTDRSSGVTFEVSGDATLLDAIQAAGLKINYGCRSGVCGADPVAICEGGENIAPASEEETATLRRLGLEGRARAPR